MKKFAILSSILLFLLLILTGCGQSGKSQLSNIGQVTGTDGVKVELIPSSFPSTVYYNKAANYVNYRIDLDVRNRGAFPTGTVWIGFAGFDSNIVDIKPISNIMFTDEGDYKSRYNPEGGYKTAMSEINVKEPMGSIEQYDIPLKIMYCYKYETHASITLCVDPTPNEITKDDTCTPSKVTTSGQGAPVSIESVEVESIPGKVRVNMLIKDHTGGELARSDLAIDQCIGGITRDNEKYVKMTSLPSLTGSSTSSTNSGASCNINSDGMVRLRDGQATVSCTFPLDLARQRSAYKTVLTAGMEYVVRNSIEKNIKIINEDYKNSISNSGSATGTFGND